MKYTEFDGAWFVRTAAMDLSIRGSRVEVRVGGAVFAELDMASRAPVWDAESGSVLPDEGYGISAPTVTSEGDCVTFTWTESSSLWEKKEYILRCTPLRAVYSIRLHGHGAVEEVQYFSGSGQGEDDGSSYQFSHGFFPGNEWHGHEPYTFSAGNPFHRQNVLMVPPMFCYSFFCEDAAGALAMALAARPGEHNFLNFDYRTEMRGWRGVFHLATDQHGHTHVDGVWETPEILLYGARDEKDACRAYVSYYFSTGYARRRMNRATPRFWHGPILCGWIEQMALAHEDPNREPPDFADEATYRTLVQQVLANDLHPRLLIVDDKWQKNYATDEVDTDKWHDLRAFVEEMKAKHGIHTMLWFKMWDAEGLSPAAVLPTGAVWPPTGIYDPSHPEFLHALDEALYRILSSDDGCLNCDGMKLDYAMDTPDYHGADAVCGKYGVELLYFLMEHIYTTAKKIKPEAIINASPCHPYFSALCDQSRLHDYNQANRNNYEDMRIRAELYSIANPDALIDTDNAGFSTRRDTLRYLLNQPKLGIPDLYASTGTNGYRPTEDEWEMVAAVWKEYEATLPESEFTV